MNGSFIPDSLSTPAAAERNDNSYNRTVEATGRDLMLSEDGDLVTSLEGDLVLLSGTDLITRNLLRRLYTAMSGYARWIRTAEGLREIDSAYGTGMYDFVSSSMTQVRTQQLVDAVSISLSQETRIHLHSVYLQPLRAYTSTLEVVIVYSILGEERLRELRRTLS